MSVDDTTFVTIGTPFFSTTTVAAEPPKSDLKARLRIATCPSCQAVHTRALAHNAHDPPTCSNGVIRPRLGPPVHSPMKWASSW